MHNVVFCSPILNLNSIPTIEAITSLDDVQVTLISQEPQEKLPPLILRKLRGFVRIENALNEQQLLEAARSIEKVTGNISRIFAANEQVQVPVAMVREALGIDGMSAEAMRNFRDKSRMKGILRSKGIPCAKFALAQDNGSAWDFVYDAGYPVIVKPPEGAGAEFTYFVDNKTQLEEILSNHPPDSADPLLLEEFVSGEEHSFDAFTVNGKIVWHSVTRYLPSPLEVKRNPWIQWRVILPRDIDDPKYDSIRKVGKKALKSLGAQTGISHMEWFRRPDGTAAVSEVGMRPPGAQFTTLMSRAHEFNCVESWARLMITGQFTPPLRKYAAGCAYLRGQGEGIVREVNGFDKINRDIGDIITDVRLPEYGQKPTGSYEGEGFIIVRHPETQVVEEALMHIVSTMRIHLG